MTITLSLKEKCYQDAVHMLYRNVIVGIVTSSIVSFILFWAFIEHNTPQKALWLIAINVVLTLRFLDVLSFKRACKKQTLNIPYFHKRFIFFIVLVAFVWCFYFLFLCDHNNSFEVVTNFIMIAGLTSGSFTILASDKKSMFIFLSVLIYPFSFFQLFSDIVELRILAWCSLVYSLVVLSLANRLANFTNQAIYLKNENASLVEDMEQQVQARTAEIHRLSDLDPITYLPNKSAFLSQLQTKLDFCQKSKQTLTILFIDLDSFESVNQNVRYTLGDQLLEKIAERLLALEGVSLLCRWNSNEFALVLLNHPESDIEDYANRVIKTINDYYLFTNNFLSQGATVGVSYYPKHAMGKEHLIELAASAMLFQKKYLNSNIFIFSEDLNHKIIREQSLKICLDRAIKYNELRLIFQPILCANTRKVVALDALINWQFNGENIEFEELLDIAEQTGQIHDIGYWYIYNACKAVKALSDESINTSIHVKVSPLQLQSDAFVSTVEDILLKIGLPQHTLCVEIAESYFNTNVHVVYQTICLLKELGIDISIGNFGTGLQSFLVVRDLPISFIKMDNEFIKSVDVKTIAILNGLQTMTSSLHCKVVVTGIENKQQKACLNEIGIDYIQGSFIHPVIKSEELLQNISIDNTITHE